MLFDLPLELLSLIYSYDGTYKEIYNDILLEIKEQTPKFMYHYLNSDNNDVYVFKIRTTKLKKISFYITHYTSNFHYTSYKKAFTDAKKSFIARKK